MKTRKAMPLRQRGFSIIELLIAITILTAVVGVTLTGLNQVQKRGKAEAEQLDATQQVREAMDTIVRDLHQAGYPSTKIFVPGLAATDTRVAQGFIAQTANSISFEEFVDTETSGVQVISYQLVPGSAALPRCPCVQRSQVPKEALAPGVAPPTNFVTLVENVNNFQITAFDSAGNPAATPDQIKMVTVKLAVATQFADLQTNKTSVTTFQSSIHYNN
jgi:prepilin-type N-terminal cleavage/methylation domain-containing protein